MLNQVIMIILKILDLNKELFLSEEKDNSKLMEISLVKVLIKMDMSKHKELIAKALNLRIIISPSMV